MESRLRKFIGARREKPAIQTVKIDAATSVEQSATPTRSIRALAPLPYSGNKCAKGTIPGQEDFGLQAVPYNTIPAGRAPVFTSTPVKGNGPIKLQANRRSSTGELEAAIQSYAGILDDIREGDYIVGRKLVLNSRSRPGRSPTPHSTPALSLASDPESFQSPRPAPSTPNSQHSSKSMEFRGNSYECHTRSIHSGLGLSSTFLTALPDCHQSALASSALKRSSYYSQVSTATTPSVHVADDQNATIAALWKAEYNILVDAYGRDHIGRKLPHFISAKSQCGTFAKLPRGCDQTQVEEGSVRTLFRSDTDTHTELSTQFSHFSRADSCNDDSSDSLSNKRTSVVSSCAGASSCTTQTSVTEHDVVMIRDDIRKIINEMRSTYLHALESKSPPVNKPVQPLKKNRRSKLGSSMERRSVKVSSGPDRQTWHGNSVPPTEAKPDAISKIRAASQPIADLGRLSDNNTSQALIRNTRPTDRLQRADSATLGSIVANVQSELGMTVHKDTALTETRSIKSGFQSMMPSTLHTTRPEPVIQPNGNFF